MFCTWEVRQWHEVWLAYVPCEFHIPSQMKPSSLNRRPVHDRTVFANLRSFGSTFTFSNRWPSKYCFYFSCCCQFKCFLKIFGISFKELYVIAARHPCLLSCASYILAQSIMKYRLIYSTRNVNYFIYKNLLISVKSSCACVRSPLHRWNIMKNYNKCILQKFQLYIYEPLVF